MTLEQFLSTIQSEYREDASNFQRSIGELRCPWQINTASIVSKPNIILTVKNIIFDRSMNYRGDLSSCVFAYQDRHGDLVESPLKIRNVISDQHTGSDFEIYDYQWAVIETEGILDVDPLPLLQENFYQGDPPTNVFIISSGHDNWIGESVDEKSFGYCEIKSIGPERPTGVRQFRTNCDTGRKASGSPIGVLQVENGELIFSLIAIQEGSSGSDEQRGAFDVANKFSAAIAISGEFLEAIKRLE